MGDWCGVFTTDTKGYGITNAMFVAAKDKVDFLCCYQQSWFGLLAGRANR